MALICCLVSIYDGDLNKFFVIICIIVLICLCANEMFIANKPTAMDVYQGKTELEFTVVNGEAIDSTVIFKKK